MAKTMTKGEALKIVAESGLSMREAADQIGVSDAAVYAWKKNPGGRLMTASALKVRKFARGLETPKKETKAPASKSNGKVYAPVTAEFYPGGTVTLHTTADNINEGVDVARQLHPNFRAVIIPEFA